MLSPGNSEESIQILPLRDTAKTAINITRLPAKILLEIFLYLNIGSILNVKKICRAFYNTTRSRQLWYNFIKSLESLKVRPPEEPLEKYSAGELERWVSRRCWALVPWNSFYCNVFRYPLHDIGDRPLSNRSIVPGGRWLLVLRYDEVYAFDLESKSPLKGRPLFNLADSEEGWICYGFTCNYWVDDTKPQLSFRIAVWGGLGAITGDHVFIRIVIYQVELSGHGSDAILVAEPLTSMLSPGGLANFVGCLNAEYFVQSWYSEPDSDHHTSQLRSYRYNTNGVQREGRVKPSTLSTGQSDAIRYIEFISDNRIVAFGGYLQIFAISPSENDGQRDIITLLHTIPSSGYPEYSSLLCFSPLSRTPYSTYKMVILSDFEVRGIEIPDEDPSATTVTKLIHQEYELCERAALGLRVGVIAHYDGTMDFLSYSWGRGENVTFKWHTSRIVGVRHVEAIVVSEDLAQIVVSRDRETALHMVLSW